MAPKDLMQVLKDNLEIQAQLGTEDLVVQIQNSGRYSKATVAVSIEGKIRLMEVMAREVGVFDGITIRP